MRKIISWIMLVLMSIIVIEYKTGAVYVACVDGEIKENYPTTVIKLKGRARGHKKYIDMRRVKEIYKITSPYEDEGEEK